MNAKKLILDDLKKQGLDNLSKKIKSIKKEGSSLRVKTIDLFKSERKKLEAILAEYEEGTFDGMNDIYEIKSTPHLKPISFKYVFIINEHSEQVENDAKKRLEIMWGITDDQTARERMGCWYNQALNKTLSELEAN